MIVLDTSVVLAFMNRADNEHESVRTWIAGLREELVTTPLAVAEMDHLSERFGGAAAAEALRRDLEAGAYTVEWWDGAVHESVRVARRHAPDSLGLTDASLVTLAARLATTRIATLDQRHFRAVQPLTGEAAFTLLPTDR